MTQSGSPDINATMELLAPLTNRDDGARRLRVVLLLEEQLKAQVEKLEDGSTFGRDPLVELNAQLAGVLLLTAGMMKTILEARIAEFDEHTAGWPKTILDEQTAAQHRKI
jgi:hypothetical protein